MSTIISWSGSMERMYKINLSRRYIQHRYNQPRYFCRHRNKNIFGGTTMFADMGYMSYICCAGYKIRERCENVEPSEMCSINCNLKRFDNPRGGNDIRINSSPPCAAYMRQWMRSALVRIMACRLFGAKQLSEPVNCTLIRRRFLVYIG